MLPELIMSFRFDFSLLHIKGYFIAKNSFVAEVTFNVKHDKDQD